MARTLTLQKGLLPAATQRRLSQRYQVMGITLIWDDVTSETNRKEINPGRKRNRNPSDRQVKSKTCRLCKLERERAHFISATGKLNTACTDCLNKPTRVCDTCAVDQPREMFTSDTKRYRCYDCLHSNEVKAKKKLVAERTSAKRKAERARASSFEVRR